MKKALLFLGIVSICSIQSSFSQSCNNVCPAVGLSTQFEWIKRVSIGPLFNQSGNDGGYADFGDEFMVDFTAGESYSYAVSAGYGDGPFSETWKAWMDFNHDGDFTDPGEQVFTNFGQYQVYGNFSIPSDAYNGSTRLRVAMGFAVNNLCENINDGEIEDYCVNIIGGVDPPNLCDSSEPVTGLTSSVGPEGIVLSWDPVPYSVRCRVSGGLLGSFNIRRNVIGFEASSFTAPLSALAPGTYNWRVRCGCENEAPYDFTPNSEVDIFAIPENLVAPEGKSLTSEIGLVPNPNNGLFRLYLNSEMSGVKQVTISDMLGRVLVQEDFLLQNGGDSIEMDVTDLDQGTYILYVTDNDNLLSTVRFIKE